MAEVKNFNTNLNETSLSQSGAGNVLMMSGQQFLNLNNKNQDFIIKL